MSEIVIFGCGYTGLRVARRLVRRGFKVRATARSPVQLDGVEFDRLDFAEPEAFAEAARLTPRGARALISLPSFEREGALYDPVPELVRALGRRPSRVVYLSTTGVYGPTKLVDETTLPNPRTKRQRLRAEAERAVLAGPWKALTLRAGAIYGPGRGVHVALAEGRYKLVGAGSNYVSRIHVDDLAAIGEAALLSDVTGAYPVADDDPSTSREIAEFCCELLGLPPPGSTTADRVDETRRADRRVDARAIRRLLGVELRYPSYRSGIPAAIREAAQQR